MAPVSARLTLAALRQSRLSELEQLAEAALEMEDPTEIEQLVKHFEGDS